MGIFLSMDSEARGNSRLLPVLFEGAEELNHIDSASGLDLSQLGIAVACDAFDRGLLVVPVSMQDEVIKQQPPLIVTDDQISEAVGIVKDELGVCSDLAGPRISRWSVPKKV